MPCRAKTSFGPVAASPSAAAVLHLDRAELPDRPPRSVTAPGTTASKVVWTEQVAPIVALRGRRARNGHRELRVLPVVGSRSAERSVMRVTGGELQLARVVGEVAAPAHVGERHGDAARPPRRRGVAGIAQQHVEPHEAGRTAPPCRSHRRSRP